MRNPGVRTNEQIAISQCTVRLPRTRTVLGRCTVYDVGAPAWPRIALSRAFMPGGNMHRTHRDVKLRFLGYLCMQIIPVARSECFVEHKRGGPVRIFPPPCYRSGVLLTRMPFALRSRCAPSLRMKWASCEKLSWFVRPMPLSARGRTSRRLCRLCGFLCHLIFVLFVG